MRDYGTETNANYELVMKDLSNQFFLPKELQHQERYICRGVYNPCDTKICKFICSIDEIVNYLKKFPPFGANQALPKDEILKLVEFSMPIEWQK